jgi:hypothetical protein
VYKSSVLCRLNILLLLLSGSGEFSLDIAAKISGNVIKTTAIVRCLLSYCRVHHMMGMSNPPVVKITNIYPRVGSPALISPCVNFGVKFQKTIPTSEV